MQWWSRSEDLLYAVATFKGENLSKCMFVCDNFFWQFCFSFLFQVLYQDKEISNEEFRMAVREICSNALFLLDREESRRIASEVRVTFLTERLSKARQKLQEARRSQEESEDKGKMQLFMYYGLYLILQQHLISKCPFILSKYKFSLVFVFVLCRKPDQWIWKKTTKAKPKVRAQSKHHKIKILWM